MNKEIEAKILEQITQKRENQSSFEDIINGFEQKFSEFNLSKCGFDISKYFYEGSGTATAKKKLVADGIIKSDWLKVKDDESQTDFKGLYVFLSEDKPFYVGISKNVIQRINQHIKGHNHNSASLAYSIGLINHEFTEKKEHKGSRENLDFEKYVKPVQKMLLNQKIALFQIDNDDELYLFEVFCSMKLQTNLNKFKTH
jgi:predicted GIY-YIG superfamily endonuclease